MKIIDVKNADITQNPHEVDARKIYDTENAQVVHITLKPGESLKRHVTPVDVIFYVLSGMNIGLMSKMFGGTIEKIMGEVAKEEKDMLEGIIQE